MKKTQKGYNPTQIIFSATSACNLKCPHCFVNRNPTKLSIDQALNFLENCVKTGGTTGANGNNLPVIEKIGFSGGEPFLYMDFLLALTKASVSYDLLFDQIMTNGDWWQTEEDLHQKLQTLYDAGYDGKIGLSWDEYHGQQPERMQSFIKSVQAIFGPDSINIQTVEGESLPLARTSLLATPSAGEAPATPPLPFPADVPVYTLPRTYPSDNPLAWKSRHWFREDYCQGPGNIFYVHANGNIAPCCGFANENPALFIGTISDSLETIMSKASQNEMLKLCFTKGLSKYRRFKKFPGKTSDICSFCDYVCRLK